MSLPARMCANWLDFRKEMETEDPFYLHVTYFIAIFLWFSVKTESESHITAKELLLQFHLLQLQLLSCTWQIALELDWKQRNKKPVSCACVRERSV